jgi:hypothetical protein
MNPIKMRAITEDEEDRAEKAVAEALAQDSPDLSVANKRSLSVRSRDSFAKSLEQMQAKIDTIHKQIMDSARERDVTIALANEKHMRVMQEAEVELMDVKETREAVMLAHNRLVYRT